MIIQKSFNADIVLKKHVLLMWKIVALVFVNHTFFRIIFDD